MFDEDTGEAIECDYCGSTDDCPHLLAVIDRSYCSCSGGYAYSRYGEFRAAIELAFLQALKAGADDQHA